MHFNVDEDNLLTLKEAAKSLGVDSKVIMYHINAGKISLCDGMLNKSICEEIKSQMSRYIGIRGFLKKHDNERFDSRLAKNREKYIELLELNSYFGIEIVEPDDILFDLPYREDFYISREDAQLLDFITEKFFDEFGMTEEEKIERLFKITRGHVLSKKYISQFLQFNNAKVTASTTLFVRAVLEMPEIYQVTYDDINSVIEENEVIKVKEYIRDFFNYIPNFEDVKYKKITIASKERKGLPAYSYEEFVRLAKILFNEEYARNNRLWEKSFESSKNIERWMYLACHYVCGWRSSDICERWIYPRLSDNKNAFKINVDTLKEDILNGEISDNTYSKIALYCIKRIEMSNTSPEKTERGKLRSEIIPDLRVFFGKLVLIAEYHHLTSGEGYMCKNRTSQYRNWVECKEFFGEEMYALTGKNNLISTRLNKSYLQGIEKEAIEDGHTTLVAHIVAGYARNHTDINSTLSYLKDHGLTGESADVVLYMMMQRGVFGVVLYNTLLAAYPESFPKLSIKEQTSIMQRIPLSAYELEALGTSFMASDSIADNFREGNADEPIEVLKAMLNIGQGMGKGKDVGVFCKRKALGYCCEKPIYNSCIANLCPYHVFTSDGIPALVDVIQYYRKMECETGNLKYKVVLNSKIKPAFKDIINAIVREMSEEESRSLQRLIKGAFNEQYGS